MKEIKIVKYVSLKHRASIIEFKGGVFVFIKEYANGGTHATRFRSLKDAVSAYERAFNCRVKPMEWDLEFDCIFYD